MLYISEPRYVHRVWGSLEVTGLDNPVGEIWWLYHEERTSSVLRNAVNGHPATVDDLVTTGELPGKDVYPVLLKTLHTAERLSLQVHPGIAGGSLCKEETWIVLAAETGTWMMGGLRNTDRNLFLDLIRKERAEEVLQRIELVTGDIYHIPPEPFIHLVQACEFLKYRVTATSPTGYMTGEEPVPMEKPRELHIEKGMEAVDWSAGGRPVHAGTGGRVDRLKLNADYRISDKRGTSEINIPGGALFFVSSGSVTIQGSEVDSPTCVIADTDGGKLALNGEGYLIEPGGS